MITDAMRAAYQQTGFAIVPAVLSTAELERARAEATRLLDDGARRGGARSVLARSAYFRELTRDLLTPLAVEICGDEARAVKATLFDKSPAANWKVPWHQDLTIAVRARRDVPGFGPWSVKDGVPHVQPPATVLEAIVAVRLHLDDTPADNGALRVLPGTHRDGRLDEATVAVLRANTREVVCALAAGDAMLMSPLLLHASSAAVTPRHRRVLHVEHSDLSLPDGLDWAP